MLMRVFFVPGRKTPAFPYAPAALVQVMAVIRMAPRPVPMARMPSNPWRHQSRRLAAWSET